MDLEIYARIRTCEKRVTGKQPLGGDSQELRVRVLLWLSMVTIIYIA